ncbi:hypothetical protein ACN4EG_27685 [Alkalinema pantanalense CENA528]|uniref:hypothetical protein n=1 Tax=Alkalinema pantanalense TaxID=1620705 RepID=UPI003D6EBB26
MDSSILARSQVKIFHRVDRSRMRLDCWVVIQGKADAVRKVDRGGGIGAGGVAPGWRR